MRASAVVLIAAVVIACRDPDDDRDHLVGFGSEHCEDDVDGLSHGTSYSAVMVSLTRLGRRSTFEGLPSFVCPVDADESPNRLAVVDRIFDCLFR